MVREITGVYSNWTLARLCERLAAFHKQIINRALKRGLKFGLHVCATRTRPGRDIRSSRASYSVVVVPGVKKPAETACRLGQTCDDSQSKHRRYVVNKCAATRSRSVPDTITRRFTLFQYSICNFTTIRTLFDTAGAQLIIRVQLTNAT